MSYYYTLEPPLSLAPEFRIPSYPLYYNYTLAHQETVSELPLMPFLPSRSRVGIIQEKSNPPKSTQRALIPNSNWIPLKKGKFTIASSSEKKRHRCLELSCGKSFDRPS